MAPRSRVKHSTTEPPRSRQKAKNPSITEALQEGVCSRVPVEYIDLFLCPPKHCLVLNSVLTFRGIHVRRQIYTFALEAYEGGPPLVHQRKHPIVAEEAQTIWSQTCSCKKCSDWLKRWVEAQNNIFKL